MYGPTMKVARVAHCLNRGRQRFAAVSSGELVAAKQRALIRSPQHKIPCGAMP